MISLRCKLSHKNSLFTITSRFLTTQTPNIETPTTSANYDHLITIAGRSRNFAAIQNLINQRYRDGLFNTTNTFNFITNTETKTDFKFLLDETVQSLARLDKFVPRKLSFDALIHRLAKLDQIKESLRVIESMIENKYGANVQTFYPILGVLTRKRKMEEAWKLLNYMKENRISPDQTAYNYLLTWYGILGDLTSVIKVLTEMEEEGLKADSRTYDALVLGACKAKKIEAAFPVLRRLEEDEVAVLYSTHVHVINALLKLGYYAQAVEFVMGYRGRDKRLDTENFGLLASRFVKLKRTDEAMIVLKEMKNSGLVCGDKLYEFYRTNVLNES